MQSFSPSMVRPFVCVSLLAALSACRDEPTNPSGGMGGTGGMAGMAGAGGTAGMGGIGGMPGGNGGGGVGGVGGTGGSTGGTGGSTGGTGGTMAGAGGTMAGAGGTMAGAGGTMAGAGGVGGMPGGMGGSGGMVQPPEICGNGVDDDGDGSVDCVDTDCAEAPICGSLVVNEVDYDQLGADTAEFVELYNAGAGPLVLDGIEVVLVNGANGNSYATFPLTGPLAAGQYLVIAGPNVVVAPGAVVVDPGNIALQNGAPDGVAIFDPANATVLDALSYEGAINAANLAGGPYDLVSGTATMAVDVDGPTRSVIRYPNAQDTGDDAIDWVATVTPTPGAANLLPVEVCGNGTDDDGDMLIDCADPDCTGSCPEVCTNGIDDNANALVDCQEMSCDGQVCSAFGETCSLGVCTCPGGNLETACGDLLDGDCDGDVDCADSDCAMDPLCVMGGITAVDYPVIAHGGDLVISGAGFTGASSVTIGGVAQTFMVDSDTQITVSDVPDATPIGAQMLSVTAPNGTFTFPVTPIHLVINELDSDTVGGDAAEFVEVATGVPGVSLAGYSLLFFNGGVANDVCYLGVELAATTDANGLVLVGNAALNPDLVVAGNSVQNGQDGVGIFQNPISAYLCNGSAAATPAGNVDIIDALVYDTADADDVALIAALLGMGAGAIQVDEGAGGAGSPAETNALKRCGTARLDGTVFSQAIPTPNAANVCP